MSKVKSKLYYKAGGNAIWGLKATIIGGFLLSVHILFSDPNDPYITQTASVPFVGVLFCLVLFFRYNIEFCLDDEKIYWERNYFLFKHKRTVKYAEIEKVNGLNSSYDLILILKEKPRLKLLRYAQLQGAPEKIEFDELKKMKNEMEFLKNVIESRMKSY